MKKTVEIEYVGIEDVFGIIDDAYAIMNEGHYVNVELSSVINPPRVRVIIMLGGWKKDKEYDYLFEFEMSDNPEEVNKMHDCKATLRNLLAY